MPAPTNPKKRALMPSTRLRKTLRAAGHHLSPVVQVGKEGVTEAVLRQLDEALSAHELVKVKIGTETPEDRFEAADRLGADSGAQVAQILGRTILVYRRHPEKPRYEAPTARPALKELESPAPRTRGKARRSPARGAKGPARGAKPGRGAKGAARGAKPARGAARTRSR
ncbi:ribosome assembly RNA-binding protein YhbY [Anaeromyxobacter sp. Fw109-5]|uniref:ribosome assembly RNA-binding protein YhbY n=1 Tax=Anaeromyxobacter sp. (strain Fw109-5) TaxID=404589 RepID=UPI0000ED79EC|nr:ribosome assembly RNA-binding protein YhbY [Anaeromyxobacter sp. Fw109-5]ABS24501.1 protein of unknown function UPF0044 [Anaeromyxobacter sp. Fw109-5]